MEVKAFDRTRTTCWTRGLRLAGQPDRHADRHRARQGALQQRAPAAFPQPVRQRAAERAHHPERRGGAGGRGAPRRQRRIRVRAAGRPHGEAAQRGARPAGGRPGAGGQRPAGGRARDHRGRRIACATARAWPCRAIRRGRHRPAPARGAAPQAARCIGRRSQPLPGRRRRSAAASAGRAASARPPRPGPAPRR